MSSVRWWQRGWSEALVGGVAYKGQNRAGQWMEQQRTEAQKYTQRETSMQTITEMGFWEHLGLGWEEHEIHLSLLVSGVKDLVEIW